jgi:hypothetical protein
MAQFSYDVVPRNNGWAIVITPEDEREGFPTKQAAYDAAAEFAHKLRFVGYSVNVQHSAPPRHAPTR